MNAGNMSTTTQVAAQSVCDAEYAGLRLDQYVADVMALASRSQLKERLTEARVNGAPVKLSYRLRAGDSVAVTLEAPPAIETAPEPIAFEVL